MGLSVRKLHPHFAAEISGVRLRDLDDPTFAQLRDAFEQHSVYLGSHASYILGLPVDEGRTLLRDSAGARHARRVRLPASLARG